MCKDVDIEYTPEMVSHLHAIAYKELAHILDDECSAQILVDFDSSDIDALTVAVGQAVINSIVVKMIKLGIEAEEHDDET